MKQRSCFSIAITRKKIYVHINAAILFQSIQLLGWKLFSSSDVVVILNYMWPQVFHTLHFGVKYCDTIKN